MSPVVALLLAISIGFLIGLERGWQHREEGDGRRIAGIRTFPLLGLGGGISGLLAANLSPWYGAVGLAGLSTVLILAHRARLDEPDDNVSVTNAVVGIVTLLLGFAATTGFAREALIAGGVAILILSMREKLHGWVRSLSEKDIHAVAEYGAITMVILPLLPDRAMGPYDALNPRMLWLVVVFVTGLSFAGYWAAKRFGDARGTVLASAIGATYSSTAVTLELARRLRRNDIDRATLNASIAVATAMMPIRVIILCAVVLPDALSGFFVGIGGGLAFAVVYAAGATWRANKSDGGGAIHTARNPFDFWPAVGFAAIVAAVVVLAHWTIEHVGDQGAKVVIGITGLYDVDAAIIAIANLPSGNLTWQETGFILSLPILANNLFKTTLVLTIAGWRRGIAAVTPLIIISLLIGGAMFIWLS